MAQMNISIPEALKSWAEARVAEGSYSSTSDYIRDLVRRDREDEQARAREMARLRQAWDEGLASGPAIDGNFDAADIAARLGTAQAAE
jgi:antitoxin ParD1/3/4